MAAANSQAIAADANDVGRVDVEVDHLGVRGKGIELARYPVIETGTNGQQQVALLHTAGAFMMLLFLISHVYLITTGHTVGAHLKAMITGWEEVDDEPAR